MIDPVTVAELFGLGTPVPAGAGGEVLVPLKGRPASVWAMDTVRDGVRRGWVIKSLRPGGAWQLDAMTTSARLERAATAAGLDLPRLATLPTGADVHACWARMPGDDRYVKVQELLIGAAPRPPVDTQVARWVGRTLAGIEQLGLPAVPDDDAYPVHAVADWRRWTAEAATGAPSAALLPPATTLLPAVMEATAIVEAALAEAPAMVLAHRDVSAANIILTPAGPRLIDWDHAGPEVPWWEVVHAAFDLAAPARRTRPRSPGYCDPRWAGRRTTSGWPSGTAMSRPISASPRPGSWPGPRTHSRPSLPRSPAGPQC